MVGKPLSLPADGISTPEELAKLLLPALPERHRGAVPDLIDQIYRHKAAGQHIETQALLKYIYRDLVKALDEEEPSQRLQRLEKEALWARLIEHERCGFALARARYVATGRPLSEKLRENWLDPEEIRRARALSIEQITAEATTRLTDIVALRRQVDLSYPNDLAFKIKLDEVTQVLEVARSGEFTGAGGSLYEFLIDAGETPSWIPPHY